MIGPILATLMYRSGKVISATLMYLKWTKPFIGVIRSRAGPGWVGPGFALATGHNPASRPLMTTPGGEVLRLRGAGAPTPPGTLAAQGASVAVGVCSLS